MLLACGKGRITIGASMMQEISSQPYWLLDASALTPSELLSLRQAPQIRWLYDHLQDEQAAAVGPVLVSPCTYADQLVAQLQADENRAWAVATLHTQADFRTLAQHLAAMRYLHTRDGQRYYLRYADSRCLVALWAVLTSSQQYALLGPVQRWAYTDRQVRHQVISLGDESSTVTAIRPTGQLRLNDQQLGSLLERTWPDQLLCSVIEQQPEIGRSLTSWQRYACAQRVCAWLLAKQEDRYPVQMQTLIFVLSKVGTYDANDSTWISSISSDYLDAICGNA
jgi:hypothetical protein